jgi:hypothetical protein
VTCIPGLVGLLIWEPGNGTRYVMQTTFLPDAVAAEMGGTILVTMRAPCDNRLVAHAVNPGSTGHWTIDYVAQHWFGGTDAPYLAMLINWVLGGVRARDYAEDLWRQETGAEAEVISLHGNDLRR